MLIMLLLLWSQDGFTPQVYAVEEVRYGEYYSVVGTHQGRLLFTGNHPWYGERAAWTSDGTQAGTRPIPHLGLNYREAYSVGDDLYLAVGYPYPQQGPHYRHYTEATGFSKIQDLPADVHLFDTSEEAAWFLFYDRNDPHPVRLYEVRDGVMIGRTDWTLDDGPRLVYRDGGEPWMLLTRGGRLITRPVYNPEREPLELLRQEQPLYLRQTEMLRAADGRLYVQVVYDQDHQPIHRLFRQAATGAPFVQIHEISYDRPLNQNLSGLVEVNGTLFFLAGGQDGGVVYRLNQNDSVTPLTHPTLRVRDINVAGDRLLLSGFDGLFAFENDRFERLHQGNVVSVKTRGGEAIFIDKGQRNWHRTDGTLAGTESLGRLHPLYEGIYWTDNGPIATRSRGYLDKPSPEGNQTIPVNPRRAPGSTWPTVALGDNLLIASQDDPILFEPEGPRRLAFRAHDPRTNYQVAQIPGGGTLVGVSGSASVVIYPQGGGESTGIALQDPLWQILGDGDRLFVVTWSLESESVVYYRFTDDYRLEVIETSENPMVNILTQIVDGRLFYPLIEGAQVTLSSATSAEDIERITSFSPEDETVARPDYAVFLPTASGAVTARVSYDRDRPQDDAYLLFDEGTIAKADEGDMVKLPTGTFLRSRRVFAPVDASGEVGTSLVTARIDTGWWRAFPVDGKLALSDWEGKVVISDGTAEGTYPANMDGLAPRRSHLLAQKGDVLLILDTSLFYTNYTSGTRIQETRLLTYDISEDRGSVLMEDAGRYLLESPTVVFADRFWFPSYTRDTGPELFYSDGTVEGTGMVDIIPGPFGAYPSRLGVAGNRLYFASYDNDGDWAWSFIEHNPEPAFQASLIASAWMFAAWPASAAVVDAPQGAQFQWRIENGVLLGPSDQPRVSFRAGGEKEVTLKATVTWRGQTQTLEKRIVVIRI